MLLMKMYSQAEVFFFCCKFLLALSFLNFADGAGISSHHWNCVQEEEHLMLHVSDLDFNFIPAGKERSQT